MSYKNILLIDDDSEDTDVFLEAVNSLDKNINCLVQNNPVQALEYLKNLEILPDLIFVDFNMPVLNGNELIGRMREVVRLQAIPVILYSSYSETAADRLFIINDSQYITKPSNFNELVAVLKEILE
ncbi:response regulator [Flavobacterium sp. ACN6]|uniref:response regulator n=1 Tax=Flavobacterium sp. ACN6 TaxID=1920426 RepID=UPI000BB3B29B|nr:response regulator [Flavobacterium sp. ACN6]PBJ05435.1 Adenylate cyclase 2 [Flavobacterium sp. ACN6]